jgi:hypothetical protein
LFIQSPKELQQAKNKFHLFGFCEKGRGDVSSLFTFTSTYGMIIWINQKSGGQAFHFLVDIPGWDKNTIDK